MSLTDLVGTARGDAPGLRALAARLHRAALALPGPPEVRDAVVLTAEVLARAAGQLQALPVPPPPGAVLRVEAALAADLRAPLALLTREGNR